MVYRRKRRVARRRRRAFTRVRRRIPRPRRAAISHGSYVFNRVWMAHPKADSHSTIDIKVGQFGLSFNNLAKCYQQYRIRGLSILFTPRNRYTEAPLFYTRWDPTDQDTAKNHFLGADARVRVHSGTKSVRVFCRPKYLIRVSAQNEPNVSVVIPSTWVDTDDINASFGFFQFGWQYPLVDSKDPYAALIYDVRMRMYISFRGTSTSMSTLR